MFQLKLVDEKSEEAEFGRNALFSKHSEMIGNCMKINLNIINVNGCKYWLLKTNSYFNNV